MSERGTNLNSRERSLTIDKKFRDFGNVINKLVLDNKNLRAAINKITDTSNNVVATGSTSVASGGASNHSDLNNVVGNGPIHLDDNEINHLKFFNGTFSEKITAAITTSGGPPVDTVTLTVGASGGGDLTSRFVDTYGTLADNSTIALTLGASDAAPQLNFIYVLQTDPTALVKSTSDWPHTVDHVKVARILCPTAAFVAANGVYSFQLWNDEDADTISQGHMSHGTDRLRVMGAYWDSGVSGNGTDGYLTPTNNNTELKSNTGVVYQLHRHAVPAFDTSAGDVVLVKNWSGDAYHDITNLYDIVADSGGNAIGATKWFTIIVWGVANLTGSGFEPMIINLPSGFYNTQSAAELDSSGYTDTAIPSEFRGTGYLIARITIQRAATWVIGSTKDLRGQTPATIGGGAARYTDAEAIAALEANANTFTAFQIISQPSGNFLKWDRTGASGGGWNTQISHFGAPSFGSIFWDPLVATSDFIIRDAAANIITYVDTSIRGLGINMVPTTDLELANDAAQKPTTNTWTITPSGREFKKDIKDYILGLATLMNIRPVEYKYKEIYDLEKTHDMEKTHVGIIAEEMELVVPSTIGMGKRNYNHHMVDTGLVDAKTKEPIMEEEYDTVDAYTYNSHDLTYIMINAIKEQQVMINELKAEIDLLKGAK